MERLTKRDGLTVHSVFDGDFASQNIIHALAEYEDLEEQCLLLKLKLKVGDTFWELNDNFSPPCIYSRKAHTLQHVQYCMDRLGKITFLTEEEAEEKLEELLSI